MPGSIPGSPTIFPPREGRKASLRAGFLHFPVVEWRHTQPTRLPMRSTHFTHAITRQPPASAIHGLRAVDTGAPDLTQGL